MKEDTIRFTRLVLAVLLLLVSPGRPGARPLPVEPIQPSPTDELPPLPGTESVVDTLWFGDYWVAGAGEYHARPGLVKSQVAWTFDRNHGPVGKKPVIPGGEGWIYHELSSNYAVYGQAIDATLDLGNGFPAPVLSGGTSFWFGVDQTGANSACFACGSGYGNSWNQTLYTEPLDYDGMGYLQLAFQYFNDTESCYDGVQVYLERQDGSTILLNSSQGACPNNSYWNGGFSGVIGSPSSPAYFYTQISPQDIGGPQTIRVEFEFVSDASWSDEDCGHPTDQGPFGMDNLYVAGGGIYRYYDFEGRAVGLGAMTAKPGDPACTPPRLASRTCYPLPGTCTLSGNVLEFHDGSCPSGTHPDGQHFWIESPICDLPVASHTALFTELDLAADLPFANGALLRYGWRYYPYVCPTTGQVMWSPRVGPSGFEQYPGGLHCLTRRILATGNGVPQNAQQVRAIIEFYSSCAAFGVSNCTGVTNATPLLDNIAVGMLANIPSSVRDSFAPPFDFSLRTEPNPFSLATSVRFTLPREAEVTLDLVDASGRVVRTLRQGSTAAGEHTVAWDGRDTRGQRLASGVFLARLRVGQAVAGRKLLLME